MYSTVISVMELNALETTPIILDCRHELADPAAGQRAYQNGHIPGAIFVSVDNDLAGALTGHNGRHPLPKDTDWLERLAQWGVSPEVQVVVYDDAGGAFAARAWWLFRWAGHQGVAVLDGGIKAWQEAGLPLEQQVSAGDPTTLTLYQTQKMPTVLAEDVLKNLSGGERLVIDARSADRFRGENETLDPVGGHIPGAKNRFFKDNLGPNGLFKSADELRLEWQKLLAGRDPRSVICQCGSGVTACHNLLALEIAGLSGASLYPGSWSEWCSDPTRPMAQGSD